MEDAHNAENTPENISDVVCYEDICKTVTALATNEHIDLVETLAERIADRLMQDMRIMQIRVQIEKPEAITEAASVGIAISRLRGWFQGSKYPTFQPFFMPVSRQYTS